MERLNKYINYPVGTVFKEEYDEDGHTLNCYYIVGEYFIYCNSFDSLQIRPWKFDTSLCTIASEDEKKNFIETLKKNHLIWNEKTGLVDREFEEVTLSVKVKIKPGMDIDKLLKILNYEKNLKPYDIFDWKFEDF